MWARPSPSGTRPRTARASCREFCSQSAAFPACPSPRWWGSSTCSDLLPWQTRGMRQLRGLLTAMVTPFDADGRVNEDGAVALGRHLLANGSNGLVVCGTTGESPTLADAEQVSLLTLMVHELAAEGTIVAGAGSND